MVEGVVNIGDILIAPSHEGLAPLVTVIEIALNEYGLNPYVKTRGPEGEWDWHALETLRERFTRWSVRGSFLPCTN